MSTDTFGNVIMSMLSQLMHLPCILVGEFESNCFDAFTMGTKHCKLCAQGEHMQVSVAQTLIVCLRFVQFSVSIGTKGPLLL